jgi:ABC-type polysaccharide/polyol phosphate transport system ATPase subunit
MIPIIAKELTKVYRLYSTPYNRLKELILRRPFHSEFAAINSISFSVHQGETLGIIGENGAGKSTLLKILSKTLSPTSGQFEMHGTVSSLLELGSGFHPEFTGLENIYFYGSLLGMDQKFMETKVDEIIGFSELGDFIHYPIKTYSSGMFVRLAFSVATAVDPDLLIIDEVLSVGDLHFQKKSTDRILSFREKGKTIVFCSHEMYHIARLCNRVLWLKNGRVHMEGEPLEVIQAYETYQLSKSSATPSDNPAEQEGSAHPSLENAPAGPKREQPMITITNLQTIPAATAKKGEDLRIRIQITVDNDTIPYRVAVKIRTVDGLDIIGIGTKDMDPFYGKRTITLRFPSIQLRSGTFIIEAYAFDAEGVYWYDRKEAVPLTIPRESLEYGIVDLPHEWIID